MKKHTIIKRNLALVMLLIFTFSITPKKYLHDWVADHTDNYSFHHGSETTINNAGFNCQCQDLVVSTPFIEAGISEISFPLPEFNLDISFLYSFQLLSVHATKESRGPPALA